MLKKTIKYVDYNENEVEEEFYFNLSETELIELEAEFQGGLKAELDRIIKEEDNEKIVKFFKQFTLKTYGVKSEDGKRFVKNDEIREEFSQSAAYNQLFYDLSTKAGEAAEFIAGVVPKSLREKFVEKASQNQEEAKTSL